MKIEEKILNLSSRSLMTFGAAVSVEWQRWKPNFHSEEDNDLNFQNGLCIIGSQG